MSVVFFGTPQFAVPSLEALFEAGQDIKAIVTRPDSPKGRSKKPMPPPVKERAMALGVNKILQPMSLKDKGFLLELSSLCPEFVVTVAYGKLLTAQVLETAQRAAINVHASLLPKYRGASPIASAIMHGNTQTGVTTMLMAEGLDEGDVLLMEQEPIQPNDTTGSLSERLSHRGAALLVRTLSELRAGTLKPVGQQGEPSYAPLLKKQDGRVDWSKTAAEISCFVRAMTPWPSATSTVLGESVKILKATPAEGGGDGPPGTVMHTTGEAIFVAASEGQLRIAELQPQGKKPMPARAFLQGRKIIKGSLFI